jgi:hypothetical protein
MTRDEIIAQQLHNAQGYDILSYPTGPGITSLGDIQLVIPQSPRGRVTFVIRLPKDYPASPPSVFFDGKPVSVPIISNDKWNCAFEICHVCMQLEVWARSLRAPYQVDTEEISYAVENAKIDLSDEGARKDFIERLPSFQTYRRELAVFVDRNVRDTCIAELENNRKAFDQNLKYFSSHGRKKSVAVETAERYQG